MQNHLFVIIDDIRYDVYRATELENLPQEPKVRKCYSPACWTGASILSYLTGFSPLGASDFPFREGGIGWMPEQLKEKGYNTSLHSANGWLGIHSEQFSKGFDEFDVVPDKQRDYSDLDYEEPFFKVVHFLDTHSPVYDGEQVWEYGEDRYSNIKIMKKGLKYTDERLGEIIEQLPDNTIITVVGDHGEYFGETQNWGHSPDEVDEPDPILFQIPYAVGKKEDGEIEWEFWDDIRQ